VEAHTRRSVNRADEYRLAQTLRMCDDTIAQMRVRADPKLEHLLTEVVDLRRETLAELTAVRSRYRARSLSA
jgi:hypothetical protein